MQLLCEDELSALRCPSSPIPAALPSGGAYGNLFTLSPSDSTNNFFSCATVPGSAAELPQEGAVVSTKKSFAIARQESERLTRKSCDLPKSKRELFSVRFPLCCARFEYSTSEVVPASPVVCRLLCEMEIMLTDCELFTAGQLAAGGECASFHCSRSLGGGGSLPNFAGSRLGALLSGPLIARCPKLPVVNLDALLETATGVTAASYPPNRDPTVLCDEITGATDIFDKIFNVQNDSSAAELDPEWMKEEIDAYQTFFMPHPQTYVPDRAARARFHIQALFYERAVRHILHEQLARRPPRHFLSGTTKELETLADYKVMQLFSVAFIGCVALDFARELHRKSATAAVKRRRAVDTNLVSQLPELSALQSACGRAQKELIETNFRVLSDISNILNDAAINPLCSSSEMDEKCHEVRRLCAVHAGCSFYSKQLSLLELLLDGLHSTDEVCRVLCISSTRLLEFCSKYADEDLNTADALNDTNKQLDDATLLFSLPVIFTQ